jgi:hypothetical protein
VIIMRATLIAAFAACFAIMLLISPKPAVSLPAAAALHHGQTDTGIVQEVKKKYRYGYRRYPHYRVTPTGHITGLTIGPTAITAMATHTGAGQASASGSASKRRKA